MNESGVKRGEWRRNIPCIMRSTQQPRSAKVPGSLVPASMISFIKKLIFKPNLRTREGFCLLLPISLLCMLKDIC